MSVPRDHRKDHTGMDEKLRELIEAIVVGAEASWRDYYAVPDALLAASCPPACPTCRGEGVSGDWSLQPGRLGPNYLPTPCNQCPTVGRVLAVGIAALTATASHYIGGDALSYTAGLIDGRRQTLESLCGVSSGDPQ